MQKNIKLEYIHHIQEWQRVGGTVSGYCRQHGLSKSMFYYYKQTFQTHNETNNEAINFKSVSLLPSGVDALMSIQYPNGITLLIHQMVDVTILKTLLYAAS